MSKRLAVCMLIFLIISPNIYSQEGNWDVYMAQYEKGAGSTVLNMGLKSQAPNAKYKYLLTTGVSFADCSAEGLPTQQAFSALYAVSDSVEALMGRAVPNMFVGTFTYQCERLDYYYVSDTTGVRTNLENLYSTHFKGFKPAINIKPDAAWDAYLLFLYPNDETFETMQNQKVVLKLSEAGDKLLKARKVDHWLYFKTIADRDCFEKYAAKNKFKIEGKDKTGDADRAYKLQISRTDKIDIPTITQITLQLRKEAESCGGEYDGWETFAVK